MFGATLIVPLGFKVKPVGVAVFQVSVTELILGFGTPLSLSLVNTLGVVPPVVLVIVVTPSFTASIVVGVATAGTNTFTVAVAVAQLSGFKRSQMLYTIS